MAFVYLVIRVLRDTALVFVLLAPVRQTVAKRLGSAQGVCVLILFLLLDTGFLALFGRSGSLASVGIQGVATMLWRCVTGTALVRYYASVPMKCALVEGFSYAIVLRISQMIFSDILPLLDAALVGQGTFFVANPACETLVVAVLCVPLLSALALRVEDMDGRYVGRPQILILILDLILCMLIRLTGMTEEVFSWAAALRIAEALCLFALCYIVKAMVRSAREVALYGQSNKMLRAEYDRLFSQSERDDNIRVLAHDVRHAITLLTDQEGASGLANKLLEGLKRVEGVTYTANGLVNALLNNAASRSKKMGVRFEARCNIGSCDFIDDYDLCAILSNGLSNALEAVEIMPKTTNRFLLVEAVQDQSMLIFRIQNSFSEMPGVPSRVLSSLKLDTDEHGIGLRSIASQVEKYGGTVLTATQHGVFILTVSIPLP